MAPKVDVRPKQVFLPRHSGALIPIFNIPMKLATWNVNSLKVRQQHVIDWLASSQVDVLCLQELKLTDDKFPRADLEAVGYKSWFTGQKTYNGVAILAREGLVVDETTIVRNIPAFED